MENARLTLLLSILLLCGTVSCQMVQRVNNSYYLDGEKINTQTLDSLLSSRYSSAAVYEDRRSLKNRAAVNIGVGGSTAVLGLSIFVSARRATQDEDPLTAIFLAPSAAAAGTFGLLIGLPGAAMAINGVIQLTRSAKLRDKAVRAYNADLYGSLPMNTSGPSLSLGTTAHGVGLAYTF